jgi:hypothetical protein
MEFNCELYFKKLFEELEIIFSKWVHDLNNRLLYCMGESESYCSSCMPSEGELLLKGNVIPF